MQIAYILKVPKLPSMTSDLCLPACLLFIVFLSSGFSGCQDHIFLWSVCPPGLPAGLEIRQTLLCHKLDDPVQLI